MLKTIINPKKDSYSKESPDLTIDVTLDESASNLTLGGGGGGAGGMGQSATRILRKYGTSIMSITCQDAIDGHHVTRTLGTFGKNELLLLVCFVLIFCAYNLITIMLMVSH